MKNYINDLLNQLTNVNYVQLQTQLNIIYTDVKILTQPERLENWLLECIEIKLNPKECEIMVGLPNAPNEHLDQFSIIMTKWYINNQRSENKPLYLYIL